MKYLDKSFSTYAPAGQAYRDNHDAIFAPKDKAKEPEPPKEPEPKCVCNQLDCDNNWFCKLHDR